MSPHLDLTAPYAPLVRRIETEATVERGEILRIDHFLNHRIEPGFIFELAHELARRLSFFQPNIILTAEASGIAPALIVAKTLNVPLVYAKKSLTPGGAARHLPHHSLAHQGR
jgi:xanthine phosphoribosyltransferase